MNHFLTVLFKKEKRKMYNSYCEIDFNCKDSLNLKCNQKVLDCNCPLSIGIGFCDCPVTMFYKNNTVGCGNL